jgi:dCTP diphosphatase
MTTELEDLFIQIKKFSDDRDWVQFHTPKNLILAIVAELGELAEVIQWKTDEELLEFLITPEGKMKLSEEIADIAIYLIRLCQIQDLNLLELIGKKLIMNANKYPIEQSKGSANKYNALGK